MRVHSRLLVTIGVAAATALLVTSCSSTAPSSGDTTPTSAASFDAINERLATASQPVDEFVAPGPAFDTSSVTSGTVYVVVPALEVADFSVVANAVTGILAPFGVDVQACGTYGGAPDGVSNCLQQAIDAQAIGIITVGITADTAPTALAAVYEAGIPTVNALSTLTGPGDPTLVSYIMPDFVELHSWLTDFAIVNSGGDAGILGLKSTDGTNTAPWIDGGVIAEVDAECADCQAKALEVNVPNADKIAAQVSTVLVSNPNIGYIVAGTNNFVPDAISGAQAAGRTSADTQVGTVGGSLGVLQQEAQHDWVTAVAGFSLDALSWYAVDQLLRLIEGQPVAAETDFPYKRLFTSDNIGDLTLTQEAWLGGSWYGDADYPGGFRALWGRS